MAIYEIDIGLRAHLGPFRLTPDEMEKLDSIDGKYCASRRWPEGFAFGRLGYEPIGSEVEPFGKNGTYRRHTQVQRCRRFNGRQNWYSISMDRTADWITMRAWLTMIWMRLCGLIW